MNKKLAAGAAALLLCGGLWFLFSAPEEGTGTDNVPVPAMEFSDTEVHEMENGNIVWKMNVGHATLDADKNTMHFTDVDGYFKNDDMELTLKARSGMAKRQERLLYLEGDVEGQTSDGAVLHAENLTYDGTTNQLSTDRFFTVEKDGKILSADSFTADRILQMIEARGNARLADKEEAE